MTISSMYSAPTHEHTRMEVPPGTRDITFAAPKSVSALMALMPPDDDRFDLIFASHDRAVRETIAWLDKEAAFAKDGPASLDCKGLQSSLARHFSTPMEQPHIHTHVLVKPTVIGLNGRAYPLHWEVLQEAMVAAPAMFMAVLRGQLSEKLGIRWNSAHHERDWELVGIPDDLLAKWSDTTCNLPGIAPLEH